MNVNPELRHMNSTGGTWQRKARDFIRRRRACSSVIGRFVNVELSPTGATWRFDDNVEHWIAGLPVHAASAIALALGEGTVHDASRSLFISADHVAKWPESTAKVLGLPPNCPLSFDVRLSGAMGKPGASIAVRWLQPGKTIAARDLTQDGLWVNWEGKIFRVASPLFETLGLVKHSTERRNLRSKTSSDIGPVSARRWGTRRPRVLPTHSCGRFEL